MSVEKYTIDEALKGINKGKVEQIVVVGKDGVKIYSKKKFDEATAAMLASTFFTAQKISSRNSAEEDVIVLDLKCEKWIIMDAGRVLLAVMIASNNYLEVVKLEMEEAIKKMKKIYEN